MIAMLLLLAAPEQAGAHIGAVATARIVRGARVALSEQQVQSAPAEPQLNRIVRQEEGQQRALRLVEFQ